MLYTLVPPTFSKECSKTCKTARNVHLYEKNPHAFQGATNNAQISGVQCKIYGAQVETTAIFALTVQEIMEQEAMIAFSCI